MWVYNVLLLAVGVCIVEGYGYEEDSSNLCVFGCGRILEAVWNFEHPKQHTGIYCNTRPLDLYCVGLCLIPRFLFYVIWCPCSSICCVIPTG